MKKADEPPATKQSHAMDRRDKFLSFPLDGVSILADRVTATIDIHDSLGDFIESCRNATDNWQEKFTHHSVFIHTLCGYPFHRVLAGVQSNFNTQNPREPIIIGKSFAIVTIPMTVGDQQKKDVVCLVPIRHTLHAISYYVFNKACHFDSNDHGNYIIPLGVPSAYFNVSALTGISNCMCQGTTDHDYPSICCTWTDTPKRGPRRADVLNALIGSPTRFYVVNSFALNNASGQSQIVWREAVDGMDGAVAHAKKMYCAVLDDARITHIKDMLMQILTPEFLEQPKQLYKKIKKPPPHVTLVVFMGSEEEKAKLETHLAGPDKIRLPESARRMTIDLTRKFERYGRNIAGVSVDCDVGIRKCLLSEFSKILGRDVVTCDQRFNPHISLGDMAKGKDGELLRMTPGVALRSTDQYCCMEASTFILGDTVGKTNPVVFTVH